MSRIAHTLALAGLVAALILGWHDRAVGAPDPRALVDQLYTAAGKMPIRDMIVELEASNASSETGNMVAAGTDKLYYKYPNKLRVDAVIRDPGGPLDGVQSVTIRDGTNCWQFVSMGQYPVKKKPDEPSPTLNLPYNIQRYPQDGARKYEITGQDTVDGVPCTVVKITNPNSADDIRTVWIDTSRNVPLRLEMKLPGKEGGAPAVKRVDYKEIKPLEDGRFMPHRLEIYEGGALQAVRIYRGVKVNVGLQDSLFEPMARFIR